MLHGQHGRLHPFVLLEGPVNGRVKGARSVCCFCIKR